MDEGKKSNSNEIRESEAKGIRPGFLKGTDEYSGPQDLTSDVGVGAKQVKREAAASGLKGAEDAAAEGGLYKRTDDLNGAREAEKGEGLYKFSGKGFTKGGVKGKTSGAGRSFLKNKGPFIAILMSILGVGGVMSTMQLFQPFSIVAQMQEAFNSMHISANERSARIIRWQLNKSGVKDPVVSKFGGKSTLKITESQQKQLKKQGIEYKEDFDDGSGNKVRALIYDTGKVDENGKKIKIAVTAEDFDNVYANNPEFHSAYNAGSKTWRGQFANWFGSKTVDFITTNKITRNLFQNFRTKVDENPNKSTMDVLKDMLNEKIGKNDSSGGVRGKETRDDGSEESDVKTCKKLLPFAPGCFKPSDDDETETRYKTQDTTEEGVKVSDMQNESSVRAKLDGIAAKIGRKANLACGALQFVGSVSALVAAAEALQIINITAATFEAADKTKDEQGVDSPIMDFGASLNEKAVNENYTLEGSGGSAKYVKAKAREKSAMEAEGMSALYERRLANASDPSLNSFNITSRISGFMGGLGVSMASFKTCSLAKSVAAGIGLATDVATYGPCLLGIGVGLLSFGAAVPATAEVCGAAVINFALDLAAGAAVVATMMTIAAILTPLVTHAFTRDLVSNLAGEDLGNALVSGGNMYQGSAHRGNGGSAATEKAYTKYAAAQVKVVADDAKAEREALSPFDITSKNTFMGTLMTELMALSTSSGHLMDTISAGSSIMSNSIADLNQTVSAAADIKMELPKNYEEICPSLASIGVVGDQFCNPYVITDVDTMDTQMSEVIDKVYEYGGVTGDAESENVQVVEGSKLAKYIEFCGDRQSPLGIADQNIAGAVSGGLGSAAANPIIGALPLVGDGLDILDNSNQAANAGWISGESCVAGNDVSGLDMSPDWEETKWYQRFVEDQSLAESMGLIEKSAVAEYEETHNPTNLEDETYIGMLSRYSGLSEETIADTVDFMWYADYIANYDPSTKYAFGETDEPNEIKFDNENVLASGKQAEQYIIYIDLRNKNYVV